MNLGNVILHPTITYVMEYAKIVGTEWDFGAGGESWICLRRVGAKGEEGEKEAFTRSIKKGGKRERIEALKWLEEEIKSRKGAGEGFLEDQGVREGLKKVLQSEYTEVKAKAVVALAGGMEKGGITR